MRIDAPLPSSISRPQLSQTSTVLRATIRPPFSPQKLATSPSRKAILSSFPSAAYSPRPKQAEDGLFFEIEAGLARTHDTQMAWAEIVDSSAVEILVDDRRADVRRTGNRRRIAELLADCAHDGGDRPLCLRLRLGRPVLGERNGSDQGPAPRSKVLGGEFFAHEFADVRVQPARGQMGDLVADAVAEKPSAAAGSQQLAHRVRELRIDDRGADPGPMLAPKAEGDPAAANVDVALPEGRDSEGPVRPRVTLVADAKPTEIDQSHRHGAGPFRSERLELHVARHRRAKVGQRIGEPDELVELRLFLRPPEVGVVEVLASTRCVDPGGLQLRRPPRSR